MVAIRTKFGKGWNNATFFQNLKIIRMDLPVVENLSGLRASILSLFRSTQLNFLVFPHPLRWANGPPGLTYDPEQDPKQGNREIDEF